MFSSKTQRVASNRYLAPIRQQIADLIPENSSILDLGCGTGDFLMKNSQRISSGLGVDADKKLIQYANEVNTHDHIRFVCEDLTSNFSTEWAFDCITASLFFHVIPRNKAIDILRHFSRVNAEFLVCAFGQPKGYWLRFLLWLDQRFSSHFKHYKEYQSKGAMIGLLEDAGVKLLETIDTFDPTIKIYRLGHT